MKLNENIDYILFGLTITLFQFAGYSILTMPLLAFSAIMMFSFNYAKLQIKVNPIFTFFLAGSILMGLANLIFKDTKVHSLLMWGQFYFFAIILAGVRNQQKLTTIIKYFVYLIFIADICSNALLAMGYNLSWTGFLPIRPGEILPRFPGVKNSSLYSGSISFLALCFFIHEKINYRWLRWSIIILMGINLLLAGSFRYYITLIAVILVYSLELYKKRKALLITYAGFIVGVIIMTALTVNISKSNELRWKLWVHTLELIEKNPLLGTGFFFQNLREHAIFSYHNLMKAGVTESTILLFALCFGIPFAILFLAVIYKTLRKFPSYQQYAQELGLFVGLTLDLFWGGSIDNCMSLAILLLSMYQISRHAQV